MVQLSEKQKYEIIILREQNHTINEIANKMKINRKTVMLWINNYEKNKNIKRKEGSGRKKVTSSDDEKYIIKIINNNNNLSLFEIQNILEDDDIIISTATIYRRLIENGYQYKLPIIKPFLSDDHKKKDWNGQLKILIEIGVK